MTEFSLRDKNDSVIKTNQKNCEHLDMLKRQDEDSYDGKRTLK